LDSSTDGTKDDGEVKGSRLSPFVENLVSDRIGLDLGDAGDTLECWRILGDERTFDQKLSNIAEVVLIGEKFDVRNDFGLTHARERVLDLGGRCLTEIDG